MKLGNALERKSLSFILTALVALALSAAAATDMAWGAAARPFLKGDGVIVYYDESVKHHAENVRNAYPALRAEVESKIGWKLKSRPSIHLTGSDREFNRMGGSGSIAAFAVIGKARIVVNLSSFDKYLVLDHTLRHELTHLLLHDHIRKGLPDWAEEGICEWAGGSRTIGPIGVDDYFGSFALYRNSAPLARLRDFSGSDAGLQMAYTQSGNFIRFVAQRYGDSGMRRILERLRKGDNIDHAFQAGVSKSVAALESEWRSELAHRTRWLIMVQNGAKDAGQWIGSLYRTVSANRRQALLYCIAFIMLAAAWKATTRGLRR